MNCSGYVFRICGPFAPPPPSSSPPFADLVQARLEVDFVALVLTLSACFSSLPLLYSFGPRKQNVPGGRFAFGAVDLPVVNLWAPGGRLFPKRLKTIVKYSISAVPKGP